MRLKENQTIERDIRGMCACVFVCQRLATFFSQRKTPIVRKANEDEKKNVQMLYNWYAGGKRHKEIDASGILCMCVCVGWLVYVSMR